jgi:hypothetical protein
MLRPGRLSQLVQFSFGWTDGTDSTPPVNFELVLTEPLRFWLVLVTIACVAVLLVLAALWTNLVRRCDRRFSLFRTQATFSGFVAFACLLWVGAVTPFPSAGDLCEPAIWVFGIGMTAALGGMYLESLRGARREAALAQLLGRQSENHARIDFLEDRIPQSHGFGPEQHRFAQELAARRLVAQDIAHDIDAAQNRKPTQQHGFLHEIVSDAKGVRLHRVQFAAVSLLLGIDAVWACWNDSLPFAWRPGFVSLLGFSSLAYLAGRTIEAEK